MQINYAGLVAIVEFAAPSGTRGGGDSIMKGAGMLVGNFELNPKGDQSGRGPTFFEP